MKEMFQPQLQLETEPDGEYTLHAVTICPNSSYSAGRANTHSLSMRSLSGAVRLIETKHRISTSNLVPR